MVETCGALTDEDSGRGSAQARTLHSKVRVLVAEQETNSVVGTDRLGCLVGFAFWERALLQRYGRMADCSVYDLGQDASAQTHKKDAKPRTGEC